jgi:hypothetical protein
MIKHMHVAIISTLNYIIELRSLSISQWDVEHDERVTPSKDLRQ